MGLLEGGYHGSSMGAAALAYSLEGLYGDGQNLYQYVASNPISNSDPTGLFVGAAAGFLLPGPGDMIGGALKGLVEGYAANLEWDVDWATDWSTDDQWHSRNDNSWIAFAMLSGIYDSFNIQVPFTEISYNPLDLVFAGGVGGGQRKGVHRSLPTKWGKASYSHRVGNYGSGATVWRNPKGGRNIVRFDRGVILAEVRVKKTSHSTEVRHANQAAGYKVTPSTHVWHHHWERGVMQLVPVNLHRATGVGHIGRALFW
jgi:hypothetical protein